MTINTSNNHLAKLQNVSVIGAGGKMGSGITLLLAVHIADLKIIHPSKKFILNAIDISHDSLVGLRTYLKSQIKKIAEKKIVQLRKVYESYPDLIENGEIIDQYINDVLNNVIFSTRLESSYNSNLIFEAAIEDIYLKSKILKQIVDNSEQANWILTNTSSIPIHQLEKNIGIEENIIGFHFYNPPAIQKLVELIPSSSTHNDLIDFSNELAKDLNKQIILSNDVAGFIGNGHFMRDLLFGLDEVKLLVQKKSFIESVLIINKVTQDFLIRPMGIFQLMDYVGIDVCQKILKTMSTYLDGELLNHQYVDQLIENGIKGGQKSDGTQKDGIFKYLKNKIVAVYSLDEKKYIDVDSFSMKVFSFLGNLPSSHAEWKSVVRQKDKQKYLINYFKELSTSKNSGALLAIKYLQKSKEIGLKLVEQKIAQSNDDVNSVLKMGFYHAYGPINDFI